MPFATILVASACRSRRRRTPTASLVARRPKRRPDRRGATRTTPGATPGSGDVGSKPSDPRGNGHGRASDRARKPSSEQSDSVKKDRVPNTENPKSWFDTWIMDESLVPLILQTCSNQLKVRFSSLHHSESLPRHLVFAWLRPFRLCPTGAGTFVAQGHGGGSTLCRHRM